MVAAIIILCNADDMALRLGLGIPLTLLVALYSFRTLKKGIKDEA